MTALDAVVHMPFLAAADRIAKLSALFDAVAADCQRLGVGPSEISPHYELGQASVAVGLPDGDLPGVDALGDAYGLEPAPVHGGLHSRTGQVPIDGEPTVILLYCDRQAVAS